MKWSVYVDLAHSLTREQRSAVAAAFDGTVADGCCVGPQRASLEEVFFTLEALTEDEARTTAAHCIATALEEAGVTDTYEITVTRYSVAPTSA